ncbi:alpha-L-rhamnosidase [Rhodanobacter sp. L36]|uniref:alpha-L-rhamnosidase n=1 Tax=Rhodanobacter sp. L36 TaxID=1747221 RepID=UPI0020B15E80|nr:alpha-L-rhamnosidase [Rhodanobacter sp. L36]
MFRHSLCFLALVCLMPSASAGDAPVQLQALNVEAKHEPLAIDEAHPRFSWIIATASRDTVQKSYRLRVASSAENLANDKDDVWDSGRIASVQSFGIEYRGPALHSSTRYYWKLQVETSAGAATSRSFFETGLLDARAWGASVWIGKGAHASLEAPLLRRVFHVDAGLRQARLYVAAGGYADVSLNGRPASNAVLSPDFTNYDKRVLYTATDVTALLKANAPNAIGLQLGRGFFGLTNPDVWHWERAPWHAEPRVRAVLRLSYADGHHDDVVTDGSWKLADGPTLLDDLYGGETYDARRASDGFDSVGFDDRAWRNASIVTAPKGQLVAQREQPIRVIETMHAIAVTQPRAGLFVYAFPRVIAGWATIAAQGVAGTTIVAHYGEKLLPDGTVDDRDEHHYFEHGFQTDRFTLAGKGVERWHARFSYKGFRYVQIEGWSAGATPWRSAVSAQVVHTDAAVIGHFSSANPLLDWIHAATVDTMLDNLYGIPTDTPMYEKNGWTGDGMLGADMFLRNIDSGELLAKWVQDIEDTRTPDGAPLLIAPNPGWGTGRAPPWHAAYVLVPWSLYMQRGDRRVLATHGEGMTKYVDMEFARSPGGIADTDLGDWVSPETDPGGENAPEDRRVAATAYLYRMATTMVDVEQALGNASQARHFSDMSKQVREAFNRAFFDATAGIYRGVGDRGYRQTHNLLALAFDLAPPAQRTRIAAALAADVRTRGDHLDTGALGTKIVLPVLTATGHENIAWKVATQLTFPSWGFWRANGATSLWEHWKLAARSRGHYFLGTIDDWLYGDVAGLRPLEPGWQKIEIHPAMTAWLEHAAADTLTPYGRASVSWTRRDGTLNITAEIPVGASAVVHVPARDVSAITESGASLSRAAGIHGMHACGGDVCIETGSGRYAFRASMNGSGRSIRPDPRG